MKKKYELTTETKLKARANRDICPTSHPAPVGSGQSNEERENGGKA